MPVWGWAVGAFFLFTYWITPPMSGYWFEGWWRTVKYKPLGQWLLVDLAPFVAAYVAIHLISLLIKAYQEIEPVAQAAGESKPKSE